MPLHMTYAGFRDQAKGYKVRTLIRSSPHHCRMPGPRPNPAIASLPGRRYGREYQESVRVLQGNPESQTLNNLWLRPNCSCTHSYPAGITTTVVLRSLRRSQPHAQAKSTRQLESLTPNPKPNIQTANTKPETYDLSQT